MKKESAGDPVTEVGSRRSRRDLLAGAAAGAVGVAAVGALGRPNPVLAGTDGDVVLGAANTTAGPTSVTNTQSGNYGFAGIGSSTGAGLFGRSSSGTGVAGFSDSGDGVYGNVTSSSNGVHGQNRNTSAAGFGVFGEHTGGGVAIQGNSTSPSSTSVTPTGVLGLGKRGVWGFATSGGTGVLASEAIDGTGVGLQVVGRMLCNRSGIVSIAAGKTSATVSGVPMTSASLVLATVQNNAGVSVAFATPSVSAHSLMISLNKAVPVGKTAKVAWFVVN